MTMNAYGYDLECNNLYPYQTETWTLRIKRLGTDEWLRINPFRDPIRVKERVMEFIFSQGENPIIFGHNILGYDSWVLWKDFGLDFRVGPDLLGGKPVQYFDTLFASQFLLPDRENGHSLKSWGIRFGDLKIDYRDWCVQNGIIQASDPKGAEFGQWTEQMDIYCEQDCNVTERVFNNLYEQVLEEDTMQAFRLGQKDFYLMNAQAFTGFKFDQKAAPLLQVRIQGMMQEIKDEVEPQLPPRPLKKAEESFYTMPAKPYKKDGSFSSHLVTFIERHSAEVLSDYDLRIYGQEYQITPGLMINVDKPMNLEDQAALKDYFLQEGWKPTLWNYKKDARGKPIRDAKKKLIRTTPKIQENNKICENLLSLQGELPSKIVKFLSLRNRLGVLTGWTENSRLEWDGRISAGASGIANTHRQKHTVVVNVPKAQDDILLGKEFRSLWTVEEGSVLIGCDQAALEARCEANWTFKYDDGESARELLEGDIHSKNAKAFYPEETAAYDIKSPDFDKDDKGFKPYRSKSKNGKYAITYGSGAAKLASTLGVASSRGEILFEAFWEVNPALKKLKDNVTRFWKTEGRSKWIPGIDGRRLYSRSEHSIINLLFQSTAAVIMQYSLALFDMKMGGFLIDHLGRPYYLYKGYVIRRVGFFHDEYIIECQRVIADDLKQIMEWTMAEAGVRLKLSVPLIGEGKIGQNWCETH